MKKHSIVLFMIILLVGCGLWLPQDPASTHTAVFQELYHVLDENYVFFDYKDIDWTQTYEQYQPLVSDTLSDSAFFDLMSDFVNELRDGHTRIHNGSRVSHYDFTHGVPVNFDREILDLYLDSTYSSSGKILYKALGDIGYVYIPNFWDGTEHEPFDSILTFFGDMDGMIIDIRNNGGGSNYSCKRIAGHFTAENYLGETWYVKNGPDHNDVRLMDEVSVEPIGVPFLKPTAVLINRNVYSSANDFTNLMEQNPNVIMVGDTTGGGGGVPRQYILSNNWNLFYCDTYTLNGLDEQLENGIVPDIRVDMDTLNTVADEILEAALTALRAQSP
jgi:Peptidase family S41/Tricorn protease C1 domain